MTPKIRWHLVVLGLLIVLGAIRGLFWVLILPVWYVVDEAHHYAYVEHIATGGGLPVVGQDTVSESVLSVAKTSPTEVYRSSPSRPDLADPSWGIFRELYEGVQTPLYYLLMVPIYLISRPFGAVTSIYALRVGTLVVGLISLPLVWQFARELFPKRPTIWVMAPAALAAAQGFNSNFAAATNDALVVPLSLATFILLVRSSRRGFTIPRALATGLCIGATLLTKITAAPLVAIVALGVVILPGTQSERLAQRAKFGIAMGFAAFVAVLPWLIRSRQLYGSFGGGVEGTPVPSSPKVPLSLDGLKIFARSGFTGFWQSQGLFNDPKGELYAYVITSILAVSLVAGLLASFVRRSRRDGWALVWLGASSPVAFFSMVALIYVLLGGLLVLVGRHLYVALPSLALLVAGLVLAFGSRIGASLLLILLAIVLVFEARTLRPFTEIWYAKGVIDGNLAPVVDQSFNDEFISATAIRVTPPCEVEVIGIGGRQPMPNELTVIRNDGPSTARLFTNDGAFSLYRLQRPSRESFSVATGGTPVGRSVREREKALAFSDIEGDPLARLYCRSSNPESLRFDQLYDPQHPDILRHSSIGLWVNLWGRFVPGALFLLAVGILGLGSRRRAFDNTSEGKLLGQDTGSLLETGKLPREVDRDQE